MPHVVWVNQFALLPSDGGGTRHFELGRELVRRGWRVTIIASDFHYHKRVYSRRERPDAKQPICESVEGVDLLWVWAAPYRTNDWKRAVNWLSFARSARAAAPLLVHPTIVIGSSPQLFAARAGLRLARKFKVPFIFEVRDLWPESLLAAGGSTGLAYSLMDRVAKKLYRAADCIMVLAQGTADWLIARGVPREKFLYVPNGVDVEAVHAGHRPNAERPTFSLVYAGAHGPANGLERILDAAKILQSKPAGARIRFVLIGDGSVKDELVAEASRAQLDNVMFLDAVSRAELVKVFHEADAGLMILRDAPLFSFAVSPNKLFDYLAAELPVVCNVPGDVARIAVESGAGVQARDSSGEALADAILELASRDETQRRAMGSAGRAWVARSHGRQVLGERLDGFLRQLSGN